MSEALFNSDYVETAVRRWGSAIMIALLFLASFMLAIGIQQAVTLITAKQLGGYAVTVQIGQGRLVSRTEIRGRRIEFRRQWWARPGYAWDSGMTPQHAALARLAGIGMNLLLAGLGLLDLRHRRSRGLCITVLSHLAAAVTAVAWGLG